MNLFKVITWSLFLLSTSAGVAYSDSPEDNSEKIKRLQKQIDELSKKISKNEQVARKQEKSDNILENIKIGGALKVFGFTEKNPVFRAGKASDWVETIGHLKTTAHLDGGHKANIQLTAINTAGDDIDSYGPQPDDEDIVIDELNIHLNNVAGLPYDIIIGRQNFKLGTGFLIGDGYFDSITRFNGTLKYFDGITSTYTIKKDLKVQLFALRVDDDYSQFSEAVVPYVGGGHFFGLEVNWNTDELGDIDIGYIDRKDKSALRNNTQSLYLRGNHNPFKDVNINFEIVKQYGKTRMLGGLPGNDEKIYYDRDAWGGFIDVKKTFSDVTFKPYLQAKYLHYGGDSKSSTKNEGFDPLFYDWLPWGHGAINNTNTLIQKYIVGASPSKQWSFMVEWRNYHWQRQRPNYTNKHYATALGFSTQYVVNKNVVTGGFVGTLDPRQAGTLYFGAKNDRTIRIAGLWVITHF